MVRAPFSPSKRAAIYSANAKGSLGFPVNLYTIVSKVAAATSNEQFKGGRVEIPFRRRVSEPLEFEAGENVERPEIKIELYRSGQYIIHLRKPCDLEQIDSAFRAMICEALGKE